MTGNGSGRPPHPDVLTPAEWAVTESVRHGLTNPQIAGRLGIGVDAVKFHVGNVLGKLGLESKAQLRRWDGVRLDGAMAKGKQAMTGRTGLGPIAQVARTVSDITASEAWYRDMLGLPHLFTSASWRSSTARNAAIPPQQGEPKP